MRIGAAAEQAGVNVQTLRYYERRGLLPRSPRRTSGYREFPDEAVRVVRFVKRAQDLGFTLDEIEALLKLRNDKRRDRGRIRAVAGKRVGEIERKIAELQAMK
jgi:DNA-binding transcriptional MerR regulator